MESTTAQQGGEQSAAQSGIESAQDAAQQAKEKAQEATQQAQSTLRDQIDQRTTQAGEQVADTADSLRSVGEELRKQGKDTPARLADQAAERTERVGGYLRDADGDRILRDVEDFGRRQPWVLALGGLALGVAAARFLKASSSERYRSRDSGAQSQAALAPTAGNLSASTPVSHRPTGATADPAVAETPVVPAH